MSVFVAGVSYRVGEEVDVATHSFSTKTAAFAWCDQWGAPAGGTRVDVDPTVVLVEADQVTEVHRDPDD